MRRSRFNERDWNDDVPGTALRLSRLRRALPATIEILKERYRLSYGGGRKSTGEKRLYRDLKLVGAKSNGQTLESEWSIPKQKVSQ